MRSTCLSQKGKYYHLLKLLIPDTYVINKTKLTNDSGLQVNKDCSGDIFPSPSLTEEGGEGVVMASYGLMTWHLAIRLDAMLQTVELPTGVPHLNTSLTNVDRDAFTLEQRVNKGQGK